MSKEILKVENLKVYFPIYKGILKRKVGYVKAVNGVSLTLNEQETLGIAGESGCGKTTLSRAILQLYSLHEGKVVFLNQHFTNKDKKTLKALRQNMQVIFQDPYESLNSRHTIGQILEESMRNYKLHPKNQLKKEALKLLEQVGLDKESYNRFPHQFSGGQRQRIGIARALSCKPKMIICDEAVSALDVSLQGQILNLLNDLQQEYSLSYLFITHDLTVLRHTCDRIAIMYLGKIVEIATSSEIYTACKHPYTKALLNAIPHISLDESLFEKPSLEGEIPSVANPPSGCTFHPRCPNATDKCKKSTPSLQEESKTHQFACFNPL